MSYRRFAHTADLGLALAAADLPGLLAEAARGFVALLAPRAALRVDDAWELVEVRGDDAESLLVTWLEELLYRFEVHGTLLVDWRDVSAADGVARGSGRTARLAPGAAARTDIKAVTFHGLNVRATGRGLHARVVFDV